MFYTVNMISKTGIITGDGYIEWEITVNKDHANIGGYTLSDDFNNVSFDVFNFLFKFPS